MSYEASGEAGFVTICEIRGKKNSKRLEYIATSFIDIKESIKIIPFSTASSFMVSVIPSILTNMIFNNQINKKGVIAPAALDNTSEIIKEAKKFEINLNEKLQWI